MTSMTVPAAVHDTDVIVRLCTMYDCFNDVGLSLRLFASVQFTTLYLIWLKGGRPQHHPNGDLDATLFDNPLGYAAELQQLRTRLLEFAGEVELLSMQMEDLGALPS